LHDPIATDVPPPDNGTHDRANAKAGGDLSQPESRHEDGGNKADA